jgi:hypothetical protein
MKACILQGDIRFGTNYVIDKMLSIFDVVILSTWIGSDIVNINKECKIILNEFPPNNGFSNRNLQRYSTARAIEYAEKLNCEYICKWRTDMLPLSFNLRELIEVIKSQNKLVIYSFRCLSSSPDWFSSMPDLFAFGHIDIIKILWNDDSFDYNQSYNIPYELINSDILNDNFTENWSPETELYAFFKQRLQIKLNTTLDHETILKKYCILIDYQEFNTIWFGKNSFRSIFQAYEHPWWTVKTWKGDKKNIIKRVDRKLNLIENLKKIISWFIVYNNIIMQKKRFKKYIKNGN